MKALLLAAAFAASLSPAFAAKHNGEAGKYCVRAVPTTELVTFQPVTLRCYAALDDAYLRYINNRGGNIDGTLVLQAPDGTVLFARPYQ